MLASVVNIPFDRYVGLVAVDDVDQPRKILFAFFGIIELRPHNAEIRNLFLDNIVIQIAVSFAYFLYSNSVGDRPLAICDIHVQPFRQLATEHHVDPCYE